MLQVVAWSGMLVSYTQSDGVVEAARKTFDGEHKCKLCHAIDASREAEQKQNDGPKAPSPEWSKFGKELVFLDDLRVPTRRDGTTRLLIPVEPDWLWPADPVRPPSPPPRLG